MRCALWGGAASEQGQYANPAPEEESARGADASEYASPADAPRTALSSMLPHPQVETFESADAGASLTFPQQAGTIRKNGYIVISGRPCKVSGGAGGAE
jgi:hypothetical protein